MIKRCTAAAGPPPLTSRPHVPGDGDHGAPVERGGRLEHAQQDRRARRAAAADQRRSPLRGVTGRRDCDDRRSGNHARRRTAPDTMRDGGGGRVVVLDTLKLSRELTAAGFTHAEVDSIAEAIRPVTLRPGMEVDPHRLAEAGFSAQHIDAIKKAVEQCVTAQTARTFAEALDDLFSTLAGAWNRPLSKKDALSDWNRRIYAFSGSMPWFLYNVTPDSVRQAFIELDVFGDSVGPGPLELLGVTWSAQLLLAAWFAWLIAYQKRRCSPSRLFVEGLLFPGVAAVLIKTSLLLELFGLGGQP